VLLCWRTDARSQPQTPLASGLGDEFSLSDCAFRWHASCRYDSEQRLRTSPLHGQLQGEQLPPCLQTVDCYPGAVQHVLARRHALKGRTTPQLLPIKVPRNACYHDANAEDASPERGGAGDKERSGRSRQSPQDSSRLLDLLPGNHDDLFPCMSGPAQGIKRSLSPGPCLTDAIGVVRSASALIGGIASQFGGEWPKVAGFARR
jgi:hypothetical protein